MKKGKLVASLFFALVLIPSIAFAADSCTTLKDGVLTYSSGHYLYPQPIPQGYDVFGYNYQAHMFNGLYCNSYFGSEGLPPYEGDSDLYFQRLVDEGFADTLANAQLLATNKWYWPHKDIQLMMKWSDEWLSNKDCNGDGKLDRGYDCDPINAVSSACVGAWLTNHMAGSYDESSGKSCHWTYFVKIVTPPEDASKDGDTWYEVDGTEIGPVIWGAYAVIQRVDNDPCAGYAGISYLSPAGPGFGHFE